MQKKFNHNTKFNELSQAVENEDPEVKQKIKDTLNSTDNPSEMRYLEGLLMMLGETIGELEDPPDIENDMEEYWEEY